jgi:hypothetical protein
MGDISSDYAYVTDAHDPVSQRNEFDADNRASRIAAMSYLAVRGPECRHNCRKLAAPFPHSESFQDMHFNMSVWRTGIMGETGNFEIRVWSAEKQLLYVMPAVDVTEGEANKKAQELLALHGGYSFSLEPQLRGRGIRTVG